MNRAPTATTSSGSKRRGLLRGKKKKGTADDGPVSDSRRGLISHPILDEKYVRDGERGEGRGERAREEGSARNSVLATAPMVGDPRLRVLGRRSRLYSTQRFYRHQCLLH